MSLPSFLRVMGQGFNRQGKAVIPMSESSGRTLMKAVVFNGPLDVSVVDRPIPQLEDTKDIIIEVTATAVCGSELHVYRGHEPSGAGFIMGHEFVGIVKDVGSDVQSVKKGDKVITPFTVSCLECFYCRNGFSSRCSDSLLFGSAALDGGQAEFVRVPFADGTVFKAPPELDEKVLILMADIWPTGFFGARNAFNMLQPQEPSNSTVVVIGCGPVGLCAVIAALEYRPKHLFAIDSVESRLELAKSLGAEPLNYMTAKRAMLARIRAATEGRGADAVIEAVGLSPALRTAFDVIRPWGVISSIGVHNAEIPYSGSEAYGKNVRIQMGRCPVRSIFPDALKLLVAKQDKLSFMFDKIMPLSSAVEGYELFDKGQAQKVIFKP